MKTGLEKLIQNAEKNEGEIYIVPGDVLVIPDGYIDTRTKFDIDAGIYSVKPVLFYNDHYWYVCPDCSELHWTEGTCKIQTGCCDDIDCMRHQYFDGEHFMIQRRPIFLDDGVS